MSTWGLSATQYFYSLTPEVLLSSIEKALKRRSSGRVMQLNSMENRVYEIELDDEFGKQNVIAKFYRPGRWSKEQIEEEHIFVKQLAEHEIPTVAALVLNSGQSIELLAEGGIYFAIFPKMGGRAPDELNEVQAEQVGRLLARMHNVGASEKAKYRVKLSPEVFGWSNIEYLKKEKIIPKEFEAVYLNIAEQICRASEELFKNSEIIRIHGDCHFGNLLTRGEHFFWVDFDDMVMGPPIQDLWLMLPGRDAEAKYRLSSFLEGYRQMRNFDQASLRLIEPLRALRMINFSAWIARRWEDPAFKKYFSHFAEPRYWQEQQQALEEIFEYIKHPQQFWLN